jgi:phosphomannomutase/phosphoglucomutase
MKINPFIFRGYDIRGLVDKDLNSEVVEYIGRAHGTYLKRLGIEKAVVARDCRETSPQYSQDIIRGLTWAGINVIDIGMELVGTFYWSQYYLNCKGGIYVSASHNPRQYNGFKLAIDFSETMVSDNIQDIRNIIELEDYEKGEMSGEVEKQDIREAYFKDILGRFNLNKKFRVVVDPSCSTAGAIVPAVLKRMGCEVIEKNCNLDPSFPLGAADPTDIVVVKRLSEEVLESKADIGFTYDTDGDRIGVVDGNGNILWNDVLVAIFSASVLKNHPHSLIMYNTLCSKVVEDTILKNGGKPFMWRTGHSFLKKKNQEIKAAFIGELSGHFFFSSDFYNHDDGIFSTIYLLNYLDKINQNLFEAISSLPKYFSSPEIKIYCADDKKVSLIAEIVVLLKRDFSKAKIIDDQRAGDGVRVNLDDGMFVIRYSQNAPYLTVKFESKDKKKYESLKKYIHKLLRSYKEIDWDSEINLNIDALN